MKKTLEIRAKKSIVLGGVEVFEGEKFNIEFVDGTVLKNCDLIIDEYNEDVEIYNRVTESNNYGAELSLDLLPEIVKFEKVE